VGVVLKKLGEWARALKRETVALYYAARDPRTPWFAKLLAGLVVAYAVSPIDLIPDFVPVLGYLDDVIVLPLGIWLALRLIPESVMIEARRRADGVTERPTSRTAAVVIVVIWILITAAAGLWLYEWMYQ
jgi:uncharacterized membrane protein YkvA (DUF1232 family)